MEEEWKIKLFYLPNSDKKETKEEDIRIPKGYEVDLNTWEVKKIY